MKQKKWEKFKQELSLWQQASVPGIVVIVLVIIARLMGFLQPFELWFLDSLLRLRPSEPTDDRIVIIGINEQDIKKAGTYPIPDQTLANLLTKLQKYQPRVIGIDIVRDLPVEPGHDQLVKVFKNSDNIIGIYKGIGKQRIGETINPPPELKNKEDQVGFVDIIPDQDRKYRRMILSASIQEQEHNSLPIILAYKYLKSQEFELINDNVDPNVMVFENTKTKVTVKIPRFLANTGGYINADDGQVQTLINFRQNQQPFKRLSLTDIENEKFNPNDIKGKIILIGITAPSIKDLIDTNAVISSEITGQIYGVEFLAHSTSQIVSAVKDERPLLISWSKQLEYLWILGWGLIVILIFRLIQTPLKTFLSLAIISIISIGISYFGLVMGWWIPIAPPILLINIAGFSAFYFYQYDQSLKSQIEIRQTAMEDFYEEIHLTALQTLALLIRNIDNKNITINDEEQKIITVLKQINQEIRTAYAEIERLSLNCDLKSAKNNKNNSQVTIQELFKNTYEETLQRYSMNNLALSVGFEPIDEEQYLIFNNEKYNLCLFIANMLSNIHRHAQGVKRITVEGKKHDEYYTLSIENNGIGIQENDLIRLKNKALIKRLEKQLKGEFQVISLGKKGTLCKFTWKLTARKKAKQ